MATTDYRAEQIQTKQIIASGSIANGLGAKLVIYPIDANGAPPNKGWIDQNVFNTGSLAGQDIFLFVSGGIGHKDTNNRSISVFGGDLHISGNLSISGQGKGADVSASYLVVGNTASLPNERALAAGPGIAITDYGANATLAISASLLAGTNITINQVGNSYAISSSGGAASTGSVQWVESVTSPRLRTTASVAIGSGSFFAQDINSKYFFYASGSKYDGAKVSAFGGDVYLAGNLLQFSSDDTTPSGITSSYNSVILGSNASSISNGTEFAIVGSYNTSISTSAGYATNFALGAYSSIISGTTGQAGIIGGYSHTIAGNILGAAAVYIFGGNLSTIGEYSTFSTIINADTSTLTNTYYGTILNSTNSSIRTDQSLVINGVNTLIGSYNSNIIGDANGLSYSAIIAGNNHTLNGSTNAVILGGNVNTITNSAVQSVIIGGESNTINKSTTSAILGGTLNKITSSYTAGFSAIVGGSTNVIRAADYSIILGGQNNTISGVIGFSNQNLSILGGNRNLIGNGAVANSNVYMLGTGLSASNVSNRIYLGGTNYSTIISGGLTGSLQRTITGNSYIIGGPNITIATNSLGQIEISGSAAASASISYQWIESSTVPRIRTSASVAIGSGTSFAQDIGSDIFFYVSGSTGTTSGKSVFGGDVVISGAVNLRAGMTLSGAVRYNIPTSITGTYTVSTSDYIIPVSTTGSAMTIVLDSAAATSGRAFVIKDIAGSASINNITISASFGKIDGSSTYVIAVNRQSSTVVCFTSSNSDTTWGMI